MPSLELRILRKRVHALIAGNDWAALHLRTPEELTGTLASGESGNINGHFVEGDGDDGLTWYTNPYGNRRRNF